jgi:glucokinase
MAYTRTFVPRSKAAAPFYIGIDLGGTSVKLGVVDDRGRPMSWLALPTHRHSGADETVRRMGEAVNKVIAAAGLTRAEVVGVGLGSPGTMDIASGMLLEPPNLPEWRHYPLRDRVAEASGYPVTFANDANAAAYGEYWVGVGRGLNSMVMYTLGTGVGGGIIIDSLAIDGHHSTGAEVGHVIIDHRDDARMCPCGQPGHLEAYCSATAVTKRTAEALAAGRKSSLSDRVGGGEDLSAMLVAEAAAAGDALAGEIILETAHYLGVGITSVMNVIDPEGIVIGGAMTFGGDATELGRGFLDEVKAEVGRRAFPVPAAGIKIQYAELGADAGFIGAAGLARLTYRRRDRIGNVER